METRPTEAPKLAHTHPSPKVVDWDRVFILGIYRGERFGAGDENQYVTTIVGHDYSTIDLTAKRAANRLNTKSKDPTHHMIS